MMKDKIALPEGAPRWNATIVVAAFLSTDHIYKTKLKLKQQTPFFNLHNKFLELNL